MKSIGIKLWAGMMALVALVLLLLWFFQIVFLEKYYTDLIINNIKTEGTSIVKSLDNITPGEFRDRLDSLAFNQNLSIELLDTSGDTVYATASSGVMGHMPMMMNSAKLKVFREALGGKEVTLTVIHPRFGNKVLLLSFPVKTSGGFAGVLIVNMPLAPVEDTAAVLKHQLIVITIILIAAALVISAVISKAFIRPILAIKGVADGIAKGDFSGRVKTQSQDEIGQLARTINHMGNQLSKVEQLRRDLIANVSHELRTPLSIIRGYAETIRDVTGDNPEKREKQLGIIIEESERLGKIVDDILNLSQLQSGNANISKKPFPLIQAINGISKPFEIISQKQGIEIRLEYNRDLLVEADEVRFQQVMYNLLNNAVNHTPSGGAINIRLIEQIDKVRVEVADTGYGISEADLPLIWDRFYKASRDSGKLTAGTGLGLAIVKGILEAHRVPYGIQSKKGVGTTFWFELAKVN